MRRQPILWRPSRDERLRTLLTMVGLVVANVFQPGAGMNINPATLDTSAITAAPLRRASWRHRLSWVSSEPMTKPPP